MDDEVLAIKDFVVRVGGVRLAPNPNSHHIKVMIVRPNLKAKAQRYSRNRCVHEADSLIGEILNCDYGAPVVLGIWIDERHSG